MFLLIDFYSLFLLCLLSCVRVLVSMRLLLGVVYLLDAYRFWVLFALIL